MNYTCTYCNEQLIPGVDHDCTGKPTVNDAGEDTSATIDQTLAQRGNRYGSFSKHAELSQNLKEVFITHVVDYGQPDNFTPEMSEAIEMIFHKLARIGNGDPAYDDSWRDIAGYAQLIVDILNGKDT